VRTFADNDRKLKMICKVFASVNSCDMNSIRLLCYYFRQSLAEITFRSPFVLPSVCSRTAAKLKRWIFVKFWERFCADQRRFCRILKDSGCGLGLARYTADIRALYHTDSSLSPSRIHVRIQGRACRRGGRLCDGLKLGYSRYTAAGRWRRVTLLSSNDGSA